MMKQKASTTSGEEEILKAIVIADRFDDNFFPVISNSPFALLPLVGVPFIDYTLESLAESGINETILFCSTRADLLKAHIEKAKNIKAPWSVSMTVNIIVLEDCQSFGDALRYLDARGLINGYFILMGGDSISNVKLVSLLEKHKDICKKDKSAVMTLVYKTVVPGHHAKCTNETILIAADADTNRVLFHKKISKNIEKKVNFPIEIFLEHPDVKIHNDILETHIAICSPSVLPLFADNFDFQTLDDFVKGILMNEEILASTIYWHKLQGDQYACRVTNWQMYQTVSLDIMHRWIFPLVPDMGISKQQHNYMVLRNHVYRHKEVTLAKVCVLEEFVVIASGSVVGENSFITRSVIGKNCKIGSNCIISDSFIMDNCIIEDNCRIIASVIGSHSNLKKTNKLNNVIMGAGVKIDNDISNSLIQMNIDEWENKKMQKLGEKAYIFLLNRDDESTDSDAFNDKENYKITDFNNWRDEKLEVYSSSSEEYNSRSPSPIQEDANLFLQEVIDSLARGYEEKLKCDNLILEINSSRYAYNMSLQEVNFYMIQALFNLPPIQSTINIMPVFKDLLSYFSPIVTNYIKGNEAMMDCLRAIEDCCEGNSSLSDRIVQILNLLYDKDFITEDVIIQWYDKVLMEKGNLSKNISLKKFIDWLNEASEESD